jgi:hypothetical protein
MTGAIMQIATTARPTAKRARVYGVDHRKALVSKRSRSMRRLIAAKPSTKVADKTQKTAE